MRIFLAIIAGFLLAYFNNSAHAATGDLLGPWNKPAKFSYPDVANTTTGVAMSFTQAITMGVVASTSLLRDPATLAGKYSKVRRVELSQRNWLPYLDKQRYLILSSEGETVAGHAVVLLATFDGDTITVDHASGYYSRSLANDFTASFAIHRDYEDLKFPCSDCFHDHTPLPAVLADYKEKWRGLFGPVPHALVIEILRGSSHLEVISLNSAEYALIKHELVALQPFSPKLLSEQYVKDSFRKDWMRQLSVVCLNAEIIKCIPPAPSSAGLWPQKDLYYQITEALSEPLNGQSIAELSIKREIEPLKKSHGDKYDSKVADLICFKRFKTMQTAPVGRPQYVTAYIGKMKDGYAEGAGTLYFEGTCADVKRKPDALMRLVAEFRRGIPNGVAKLYSKHGFPIVDGAMKDGLLDGRAKHFDGRGTETASANYAFGSLANGSISGAEIDYYLNSKGPASVTRIFSGRITNGQLEGGWEAVPTAYAYTSALGKPVQKLRFSNQMTIELEGGYGLSGEVEKTFGGYVLHGKGAYYWPDGDIVEGYWRRGAQDLLGPYRAYDASQKKWFSATKDGDGFRWTIKVKKKGNVFQNIGNEFVRGVDLVIDQGNRFMHGFEHMMCNALGKEEGKDCHVSAGVAVGPDGAVLTDGSGNASAMPVTEKIDWDARLAHATATELTDIERRMDTEAEHPFYEALQHNGQIRAPAGELSAALTAFTPRAYIYGDLTVTGALREERGGKPYFGAPRAKTTRNPDGTSTTHYHVHVGTDYATTPGELIYSPIDGIVSVARYSNDPASVGRNWIVIQNARGERVEVTYAHPLQGPGGLVRGSHVSRGSVIGTAGNLAPVYGPSVPNHIHVQNYIPSNQPASPVGWWVSPDGVIRIRPDPARPMPPPPPR